MLVKQKYHEIGADKIAIHDEYLRALAAEIERTIPTVKAEFNCKYIPHLKEIYDYRIHSIKKPGGKKVDKAFQYDIICFHKKRNGKPHEKYPLTFIEFTTVSQFQAEKYFYECYRWLWYLHGMGFLPPDIQIPFVPEYHEGTFNKPNIHYEICDDDSEQDRPVYYREYNTPGNPIYKPQLFQIWKVGTLMKNYDRYRQSNLAYVTVNNFSLESPTTTPMQILGNNIDYLGVWNSLP